MVDLWKVAALAESVSAVAYAWVAVLIGRNLHRGRQWAHNLLGTATFAIFAAAALGRLVHASHTMPSPWESDVVPMAARARLADPVLAAWCTVSAVAAAWFFGQRSELRGLHGPWIWTGLRRRQREALSIQKEVLVRVQSACTALEEDRTDDARVHVQDALTAARAIIGETMAEDRPRMGGLRVEGRT